jgi:hypothetical protein
VTKIWLAEFEEVGKARKICTTIQPKLVHIRDGEYKGET